MTRARSTVRATLLAGVLAAGLTTAEAQRAVSPPRRAITGLVFDSLSRRPLANALIQLADARLPSQSRAARSDASGAFVLDATSLAAGNYLIGFFHPLVDSLGLRQSPTIVRVDTASSIQVTLATPSPETIVRQLCGAHSPGDSSGAVLGYARDARDEQPRAGVRVRVEWSEYVLSRAGIITRTAERASRSGDGGYFAVCGVPHGFEVLVNAGAAGDSSGHIALEVPARGIVHRDIYVGPSELVAAPTDSLSPGDRGRVAPPVMLRRGTGRLTGRIATSNGTAIEGARVTVLETPSTARSSAEGAFALDGLPTGTYTLDVHAVGFIPELRIVDLRESRAEVALVDLTPIAVFLDTVFTRADRSYTMSAIKEFQRRKKQGEGVFMEDADIAKRGSVETTALLRTVSGLTVEPGGDYGKIVSVSALRSSARDHCFPDVFVDGTRVRDGALMIDDLVHPTEIRALEVYVRGARVPPEFLTRHSCGAIVFWTRGRIRGTQRVPSPRPADRW